MFPFPGSLTKWIIIVYRPSPKSIASIVVDFFCITNPRNQRPDVMSSGPMSHKNWFNQSINAFISGNEAHMKQKKTHTHTNYTEDRIQSVNSVFRRSCFFHGHRRVKYLVHIETRATKYNNNII